ncbi:hypothetical protein KF707_14745 [Candidatus Obscuribacterales bacterium]|nr:hypothetical protein [Candidatus Obscuribacterales bacterium]MBX3152483.1 hypothetical protein [Candidatus Obscuribacterales bacterium]
MKDLQQDTNFSAAVQESPEAEVIDQTVSFAPEVEIDEAVIERFERELSLDTAGGADREDGEGDEGRELDAALTRNQPETEHDVVDAEEAEHNVVDAEETEHNVVDAEEADTTNGDSPWADDGPVLVYDVPRPALTIDEAATILGKSIRAIERGISGKWGNRLPEGWKARKMKIDGQDEWRIIPPPSFRIRHSKSGTPRTEVMTEKTIEKPAPAPAQPTASSRPASSDEPLGLRETAENLLGFSFNSLIQTAGKKAKTELARAAEYAMESNMEHPTIVIDRSDEVERLLRQLSEVQKELSDERREHLEDLRLLAEMQGSMRMLELKSSQTASLKDELVEVTRTLQEHRRQYQEFLALPWWKRLFRKAP